VIEHTGTGESGNVVVDGAGLKILVVCNRMGLTTALRNALQEHRCVTVTSQRVDLAVTQTIEPYYRGKKKAQWKNETAGRRRR
jgi:hypothetical protein